MELLPIKQYLDQNKEFTGHADCQDTIYVTIEFYKKAGFESPWISYYVKLNDALVGCCAFKGKPVQGKVEIAYGTFPQFQKQGIATHICRLLVELSLKTDPSVRITARTLPQENYSTKLLRKNNFGLQGIVVDPEDGEVWEWEYNIPDAAIKQ